MTHEIQTTALVVSRDTERKTQLAASVANDYLDWLACDTVDAALSVLRSETVSLICCDQALFSVSSETILQGIRHQAPVPELIVMGSPNELDSLTTVSPGSESAMLTLPLSPPVVASTLKRSLNNYRLRCEVGTLRSHVAMTYGYDNIIGESPALRSAKETAARIAPTDISTLVTGPAGSGKEIFARTIHHHSERRCRSFVLVDCSALSADQLQSELFGSADIHGRSLCELADGGTLFLENVEAMDAASQSRLLAFLKDGLITTANGTRKVDVRLIAATSANLHTLVATGAFREDLFFKMAVITLAVPALADRTEDIPLLSDYFLRRISRETMRPDMTLTPLALEKLMSHHWPGNVRELENALRRAATLCADGQIDVSQISFLNSGDDKPIAEDTREGRHSLVISSGLLVHHQREVIVKALDDNRWNFTKTAAALGIGRTTLWRKVKKYNLVPAAGVVVEE